ncbi:hypothetical protein DFP72DRAFT_849711 [Ephemerocybe angulata]|uniref:Zinc finger PHD-type domain-containing protein n=1 Tax=Ephemerocybe angulata TaxID=980116 RepID=A0A8H6HUE5_9AGAR|nr:hypothetical protein DFP72DRAFT_849711 [Tulosesus angulatus]
MVFQRLGRAMRALFEDEAPQQTQYPTIYSLQPAVHNHPGIMMNQGAYGSDPRLHPAQASTTTQPGYPYQTHGKASQGPYASYQPQYYINALPQPHPSPHFPVFQPYPGGPAHPQHTKLQGPQPVPPAHLPPTAPTLTRPTQPTAFLPNTDHRITQNVQERVDVPRDANPAKPKSTAMPQQEEMSEKSKRKAEKHAKERDNAEGPLLSSGLNGERWNWSDDDWDSDDDDAERFHWTNGKHTRRVRDGSDIDGWNHTKWVFRSGGRRVFKGDKRADKSRCLGVYVCPDEDCGIPVRPAPDKKAQDSQLAEGCRQCGASPLTDYTCNAVTYTYREVGEDGQEYLCWQDPRRACYQQKESRARLGLSAPPIRSGITFLKKINGINRELKETFLVDSSLHDLGYLTFQTPWMKNQIKESVLDWVKMGPETEGRHGFVTDGNHSYFKDGVLLVSCIFSSKLLSWVPVLFSWLSRIDTAHHIPHFNRISTTVLETVHGLDIPFDPKFLLHVTDFSASQWSAHAEDYAHTVAMLNPGWNSLAPEAQRAQLSALREEAMEAQKGCEVHYAIDPSECPEFRKVTTELMDGDEKRFLQAVSTLKEKFPTTINWISWWLQPSFAQMIFPSQRRVDPETDRQTPYTSNGVEHEHQLLGHAVGKRQDIPDGILELHKFVKEMEQAEKSAKGGHYIPPGPRKRPLAKSIKFFENDGRAPDTAATLGLEKKEPASKSKGKKTKTPKTKEPKPTKPKSTTKPKAPQPAPPKTNLTQTKLQLQKRPGPSNNVLPLHISYPWKANSCFFDTSTELFFQAYRQLAPQVRGMFRSTLPKESYLFGLASHFERRLELVAAAEPNFVALRAELEEMREITRDRIVNVWKAVFNEGSTEGDPSVWPQFALVVRLSGVRFGSGSAYFGLNLNLNLRFGSGSVQVRKVPNLTADSLLVDGNTTALAHGFFAIQYTAEYRCADGHSFRHEIESEGGVSRRAVLSVTVPFVQGLGQRMGMNPGGAITLSDYLRHFIPVIGGQSDALHTRLPPTPQCSNPGCTTASPLAGLSIDWPEILTIMSDCRLNRKTATLHHIQFERRVTIGTPPFEITYRRVGCVVHKPELRHFNALVEVDGWTYTYDDMVQGGTLLPAASGTAIDDQSSSHVIIYVYVRTSDLSVSWRSVSELEEDYSSLKQPKGNLLPEDDEAIIEIKKLEEREAAQKKEKEKQDRGKQIRGRGRGRGHGRGRGRGRGRAGSDQPSVESEDETEESLEKEMEEEMEAVLDSEHDDTNDEHDHYVELVYTEGDIPRLTTSSPDPTLVACGASAPCARDPDPDIESVECTYCKAIWHEDCVRNTLTDDYMPWMDSRAHNDWCCPLCLHQKRSWDYEMLFQFILVDIRPYLPPDSPPPESELCTLLLGPPTGPKPTPRRLGTDAVIPTKPQAPPITLENSPICRILGLDIPKMPSPSRTRPQSPPFVHSSRRLRSASTAPDSQTGSRPSVPPLVIADVVVSNSNSNLPPKRRKGYFYVNEETGEQGCCLKRSKSDAVFLSELHHLTQWATIGSDGAKGGKATPPYTATQATACDGYQYSDSRTSYIHPHQDLQRISKLTQVDQVNLAQAKLYTVGVQESRQSYEEGPHEEIWTIVIARLMVD